jgi:oligopeptide/dipeptide ABC transporter ATP-binding protein
MPSYGNDVERTRLVEIKGMVPSLLKLPVGCKFVDRCPAAQELCRTDEPPLVQLGASHVRCHFPLDPPSGPPA